MIPFLLLVTLTLTLRAVGALGVSTLDSWMMCLRMGLAAMFLFTASAHWGKRRPDLIRMVPPAFPRPDLIVTITGVLEILAAVGLLIPSTTAAAAVGLVALLIAMFPANVRAASRNLTIGGTAATPWPLRLLLQIVFIAALLVAAFPEIVAVWSAPAKTASDTRSGKATAADALFWEALHGGALR